MRGVVRRHLLPAICFAVAGLVGLAAIVDHRWKQARIDRAQLAEWYCAHQGTRCGGPSSARLERRWNERQLGYEIAVGVLGGTALLGAIALEARGRS